MKAMQIAGYNKNEPFSYATENNDHIDNFLGIGGNKKKKAEKKLVKAEKKLAKGKTVKAAKKIKKANKTLSGISSGNQALLDSKKEQAAIVEQEKAIVQAGRDTQTKKDELQQLKDSPVTPAAPMSSPMAHDNLPTPIASPSTSGAPDSGSSGSPSLGGGGGSSSTGNDDPTGDLAQEKTLGGVTVTAKKKSKIPVWIFIVIGAALLVGAFIFLKSKKK